MFTNENKPEKTGRLDATLMKAAQAKPRKAAPPIGYTSVKNGLTRLGSSVRISKAL